VGRSLLFFYISLQKEEARQIAISMRREVRELNLPEWEKVHAVWSSQSFKNFPDF